MAHFNHYRRVQRAEVGNCSDETSRRTNLSGTVIAHAVPPRLDFQGNELGMRFSLHAASPGSLMPIPSWHKNYHKPAEPATI
jgi:hypothetical protein